MCLVSMNADHREKHLEGEIHVNEVARGHGGGGLGGPGGGGGGPSGGWGKRRARRRVRAQIPLICGSEADEIMERLKWLGGGRIPGQGSDSGEYFPGYDDNGSDWW